jgi:hypothetical protein
MSQNVEPKEIEAAANLYFGDGLLDIVLGLGLTIAGVMMIFDQVAFTGVYIVLLVPIMQSIKRTVTVPRLASINFTEVEEAERRRKRTIITGFLTMTVLLGLITFLFFVMGARGRPPWFTQYAGVGLVGLGVGLMALMAWVIKAKRFFVYAGLAALIFAASHWFNFEVPFAFIGLGILILLSGLEILRRFVGKYPKASH